MVAAALLPAREGGKPCGRTDVHAVHGKCGGLRPADWIKLLCVGCYECDVWLPPLPPVLQGVPIKPVCSAACAVKMVRELRG
jgi:hypothetical protein